MNTTERAALILLDFLTGDSTSKLAIRYSLSKERVCQILRKQLSKEEMKKIASEHQFTATKVKSKCKSCGNINLKYSVTPYCNKKCYEDYRTKTKQSHETFLEKRRIYQRKHRQSKKNNKSSAEER